MEVSTRLSSFFVYTRFWPQIEEALDAVVALFAYINDKDVFGEIYRRVVTLRSLI